MTTRQHRPSKVRRFVLPAITAAFLGYFAYHSVHGEYGMVGRKRLESQTAQLKSELERLQAEKQVLLTKVQLLRPSSLDQDMVDERARIALSMVHPNEVVIMLRSQPAADDQLASSSSDSMN
jgi:cell division protein FtsB